MFGLGVVKGLGVTLKHFFETYIDDLKNPNIEYISVKISTIYSQIQSLAFDHTVSVLVERLSSLYRTAAAHAFVHSDGRRVPKFVNLDMEEYRDLEITTAAFTRPHNMRNNSGDWSVCEETVVCMVVIATEEKIDRAHLIKKLPRKTYTLDGQKVLQEYKRAINADMVEVINYKGLVFYINYTHVIYSD